MKKKKALYFEILNYQKENLKLLYENFDLIKLKNPDMIKPDILKEITVLFAPLGYRFDERFFSQTPALEVIATNTTGVPHIDVESASKRGIKVISLKDEKEFLEKITPTAELTMGLIIAITRNLIQARESVLKGRWSRWEFGGPGMLSRMRLGVVGLGRLGKMVAKYASSFGMKVCYFDHKAYENLPYEKMETLEDLVSICDVITLHLDMREENRRIFSRDVFFRFKRGSYFVNTARGELIDPEALIEAMQKGIIRGAALDVLDGEFAPAFEASSHPLVRYARVNPNLIITPHIAGSTMDAWYLTQRHVIEKTIEYIYGGAN